MREGGKRDGRWKERREMKESGRGRETRGKGICRSIKAK